MPLDGKGHTENGDVAVHTGQNGVILENKAKEYNSDVLYEPGNYIIVMYSSKVPSAFGNS